LKNTEDVTPAIDSTHSLNPWRPLRARRSGKNDKLAIYTIFCCKIPVSPESWLNGGYDEPRMGVHPANHFFGGHTWHFVPGIVHE
jgi:hypothetical protein